MHLRLSWHRTFCQCRMTNLLPKPHKMVLARGAQATMPLAGPEHALARAGRDDALAWAGYDDALAWAGVS